MDASHTLFAEDGIFEFHVNARHLKEVIAECLNMAVAVTHIFTYHMYM